MKETSIHWHAYGVVSTMHLSHMQILMNNSSFSQSAAREQKRCITLKLQKWKYSCRTVARTRTHSLHHDVVCAVLQIKVMFQLLSFVNSVGNHQGVSSSEKRSMQMKSTQVVDDA